MYFHLPCLPARSPHWPLLFRAPADLVSQQRLNLNSFSSFPKPSLTGPHAAFCERTRNPLPPTDSAPLPSLRKVEHWTSWRTGTFFSEAASVCCCSKCTAPEQGDAIWSPSMETPAWADAGATGLTGLRFKWTADLFNRLFWIVLDAQLKTERNILGRWQCSAFIQCSVVLIHCKVSFDNTSRMLNYYYLQWSVSCLQVSVSGCFDLLHCKMLFPNLRQEMHSKTCCF